MTERTGNEERECVMGRSTSYEITPPEPRRTLFITFELKIMKMTYCHFKDEMFTVQQCSHKLSLSLNSNTLTI